MEKVKASEATCLNNELEVNVKATRRPHFKAGAEISGKMNLLNIEFNEDLREDREVIEVKLQLSSKSCAKSWIEPSCN